MYVVTIRVTDKHKNSKSLSLSQEIVKDYIDGKVCGINLCDQKLNSLQFYEKKDLNKLIGSAISRDRLYAINDDGSKNFYYLGDREV